MYKRCVWYLCWKLQNIAERNFIGSLQVDIYILCSYIRRLNIIKMSILPLILYIPNTIPEDILVDVDELMLKNVCINCKGPKKPKEFWGRLKL